MSSAYKQTRHICPRNCYSSCGIIAYSQDNVLKKLTGDYKHGYTRGKLCPKGYNYLNYVYHPNRLKYPLYQEERGSGNWKQISFPQAIDIIANKMLTICEKHGSTLPLALNKYSGNFGILHQATEGMFNSFGPTTRSVGSPCWSAGLDANYYDFGSYQTTDLANLLYSKTIILWGVNPAWTSIHAMSYIYNAKQKGAHLIVIDPIFTETAQKADTYIQINPNGDGALALAIAKYIIESKLWDEDFVSDNVHGWNDYKQYVTNLSYDELLDISGQSIDVIKYLAAQISQHSPVFTWVGFGIQRHTNGGQNIRAINALSAISGNIGKKGSGVYFAQPHNQLYTKAITHHYQPGYNELNSVRSVDINNFAKEISALQDPPVEFLWISCRNLLTQSPDQKHLIKSLQQMEFIVTVDPFYTETSPYADLLLPATTMFEEWDAVSSYWHHWIGINEPAITPYFESKSDLEIVRLLTKRLNELSPGFSTFPYEKPTEQFIADEFSSETLEALGINDWRELLNGPKKANTSNSSWKNLSFDTPSKKIELYSERAMANGLSPIANIEQISEKKRDFPYYLLMNHGPYTLNSQFQNIDSLKPMDHEPYIMIHPKVAAKHDLIDNSFARVFNAIGEAILKVKISPYINPMTISVIRITEQINSLVSYTSSDMGSATTGSKGLSLNQTFVDLEPV